MTLSPNRQNIKLRFTKFSNEVKIAMPWLIDALTDLKQNFTRTIIYCYSITDASQIYTYIFPECSDVMNNLIITELKDINSKMGIVITTNAQGMSIVNCYSIVLYGSYPTQCS